MWHNMCHNIMWMEEEKLLLFKLFLEKNVLNILLSLNLQNYLLCVREKYSVRNVCCTGRNLYHK